MKDVLNTHNIPFNNSYLLFGSFCVVFLLLVFAILSSATNATRSVTLQKQYLTESSNSLSVEQVIAEQTSAFKAFDQKAFGFFEDAYWFKAILPARGKSNERIVEIENSALDSIEIWFINNTNQQVISSYQLGDSKAFGERPIRHESFVFPVPSSSSQQIMLLRIESEGTLNVQARLWDSIDFIEYEGSEKLVLGTFMGCMLAIMLVSTIMYLPTQDLKPIIYAGYIFFITIAILSLHGTLFRYLWPENAWMQARASAFFIGFAIALLIDFSLRVLDFDQQLHRIYRLLDVCKYIMIGFAVFFAVFPKTFSIMMIGALGAAILLILSCAGFYLRFLQSSTSANSKSTYYSLSWAAVLTSIALILIDNYGFYDFAVTDLHFLMLGIVTQALMLSLVLALNLQGHYFINPAAQDTVESDLRDEYDQQSETLSNEEFQRELEYKVEERTLELEIALRELSDVNKELERLSSIDTLTEVMNRRFFDKRFLAEARRSRRERTSLAIAMFDIDYFKRINDEFGHLAGDECLVQFANVLKENIKRPADVICRYGGEEFVVILPDTDLSGATRLMEQVRCAVESMEVKFESNTITFTVSIGLTTKILDTEEEREAIVAFADKLLYQAKETGRNSVVAQAF